MKVLFVCAGNTCRSCMAEAIFNNLCNLKNVKAFSAGLSVLKDSKISTHSASLLDEKLGLNISNRQAVQLTSEMLNNSDLILTMTISMSNLLLIQFPELKGKIFPLNEYVGIKGDVNDPYGGDIAIYTRTFENLKNSILLLIKQLKEDKSTEK